MIPLNLLLACSFWWRVHFQIPRFYHTPRVESLLGPIQLVNLHAIAQTCLFSVWPEIGIAKLSDLMKLTIRSEVNLYFGDSSVSWEVSVQRKESIIPNLTNYTNWICDRKATDWATAKGK